MTQKSSRWFSISVISVAMASMLMHSQPIPTHCGGIGVSAIHGDGNHLGIIAVGMVLAIGMVGILHIITIIITTIRTMHGVV